MVTVMPATERTAGLALLPLGVALLVTVVLTVYPPLLVQASGKADHVAATLALWSMSAGYVRGVGFIPRNPLFRHLFSSPTCLLSLLLAVVLAVRNGSLAG